MPRALSISAKMKALLAIAGHVQQDGKRVTAEDVARARPEGATDQEIHDVVLIAAAFCMFNRYVDGLGTWQPKNPTSTRGRQADVGAGLHQPGLLDTRSRDEQDQASDPLRWPSR